MAAEITQDMLKLNLEDPTPETGHLYHIWEAKRSKLDLCGKCRRFYILEDGCIIGVRRMHVIQREPILKDHNAELFEYVGRGRVKQGIVYSPCTCFKGIEIRPKLEN